MRGALLVYLACALLPLAGCSDSTQPTSPPAPHVVPPPPAPPIPPVTPVPPTSTSGVIYQGPLNLYDAYSNFHYGSLASNYVLYDDSTFALQFSSPRFGPFEYRGRYTRVDSRIIFSWDGWSTAGPWGAEGALHGDSLSVTYNLVMQLTDFVDGTYRRSSTTP